jgi:hypothetical protein
VEELHEVANPRPHSLLEHKPTHIHTYLHTYLDRYLMKQFL